MPLVRPEPAATRLADHLCLGKLLVQARSCHVFRSTCTFAGTELSLEIPYL